ncbi:MAG: DUF418 domain-containing protein [Luteimonas sp.]
MLPSIAGVELKEATAPCRTGIGPIEIGERIQTLDVIRGFALLGILLMNVEFFSRPLGDLGAGMPATLTGLDHAAGWLIHTFVRGKFWTMFSILFGMGFAVMLTRAHGAGRAFVWPYVRRTLALAVFGVLHGIVIWGGDILLAYATAAMVLLLTLFGRFWQGLLIAAVLAAVGFAFKAQAAGGFVVLLAIAGMTAVYLRSERDVDVFGKPWPVLTLGLVIATLLMLVGGGIGIAMVGAQKAGVFVFGGMVLVLLAWLSMRFRDPPDQRKVRIGTALYLAPFLAMTVGAAMTVMAPSGDQPQPTAEQKQKIETRRAEHRQEVATEARVMRTGTYAQAVTFRSKAYLAEYVGNGVLPAMVLGLFLIGVWFVQSGAIVRPHEHLGLFRRLAGIALPLGTVLAVTSSLIATHHVPGQNDAQWQLAIGLQMLGNLPMSLGYIAVIVLLMQKPVWSRLLSWLAPAGRMALTNYLGASIIGTLFFYGYGWGHWGMGRAGQVVFVVVVFALQVLLNRWWLSQFRYGPLEWLWRWVTYLRRPQMRVADDRVLAG